MSTNLVEFAMRPRTSFPILTERDSLKFALDLMTKHRLGIACITDGGNQLLAVLSDGDLRRLLLTHQSPLPALLVADAINFAHKNPITVSPQATLISAKVLMQSNEVWDLPVVDSLGCLVGLLHGHDID